MVTASPDFKQRQLTVQKAMQAEGLSALVAYGLSSYAGSGSNAHGYIRYLTGWTARFAASMLLLPAEGSPTLLVPGAHDVLYAKQSFPWVERCLAEAPRNYGSLCRRILLDWGCQKVGLVGIGEMPHPIYQDLVGKADGCTFTPADAIIDALRLTKDPVEIAYHRQAAAISDQMLSVLRDRLSSFRGPARKLVAEMEYTGRSMGAEIATCWLVTGQPADRPHYRLEENEREVQDGDQVLVGTYVTYRGYWAHCLRMGSVGSPSEQYRRTYEAAINQHRAAAAQVRPGNDARQIQAEAIRAAEEAIPGSLNNAVWFRQAHFMGLDYAEKPSSAFPQPENWTQNKGSKPNEVILRPGMLLEVHTNLGGAGGVGFGVVGDTYLVTEDGAERITGFPQELFEA
jgi:Xaa-Pro aminopeptidase